MDVYKLIKSPETYMLPKGAARPTILVQEERVTKKMKEEYGFISQSVTAYHNCDTGVHAYNLMNAMDFDHYSRGDYVLRDMKSRNIFGFYTEKVGKYLILSRWEFNCRKVKSTNLDEVRHWCNPHVIIVDEDKQILTYGTEWKRDAETQRWVTVSEVKVSNGALKSRLNFNPSEMYQNCGLNKESFEEVIKPFIETFGNVRNIGANRMVKLDRSPYDFEAFLCYKEPKANLNGPKQKQINELTSIALPEIKYDEKYAERTAFINKVKEDCCVLRTMVVDHNHSEITEGARIYIMKKKTVFCRPTNKGKWISVSANSSKYNWDFSLAGIEPGSTKGTMLEYVTDLLDEVAPCYRSMLLSMVLGCPLLEQLYKAGFKEILSNVTEGWQNAGCYLDSVFGKIDYSAKTLYGKLGLNKYQFNKIHDFIKDHPSILESSSCYSYNPMIKIKMVFDKQDRFSQTRSFYNSAPKDKVNLSDIDNATFDKVWDFIVSAIDFSYPYDGWGYYRVISGQLSCLGLVNQIYGHTTMLNILDNFKKGQCKDRNVLSKYFDYLNMVVLLEDTVHFRPYFKDETNIIEMHDLIVDVYNAKRDKIEQDKFDARIPFWKKYEYSDEKYSVIAPTSPAELAQEGLELHHCVKSYIPKVSQGITNIVFIRENSNKEKPFFTVEIQDNTIQQIHGFANRNLETEPDLAYFVRDWEKKCKLKSSNFNKVR